MCLKEAKKISNTFSKVGTKKVRNKLERLSGVLQKTNII